MRTGWVSIAAMRIVRIQELNLVSTFRVMRLTASSTRIELTQVIEPAEKTAPLPADSTIDISAPPPSGLRPLARTLVPGGEDLDTLSVSWPDAPPGTRSWRERSPKMLPSARPVPSNAQWLGATTRYGAEVMIPRAS